MTNPTDTTRAVVIERELPHARRLGRCGVSDPGSRAEQNAVLHVGALWSRECRHLDSRRHEHGTHLRMEQSGFRPDQQQAYQGASHGWQKFIGDLERVVAGLDP